MTDKTPKLGDPVSIANRSGFPFQMRVEHEIRQSESLHRWRVLGHEVAWGDADSPSGFIDLVCERGAQLLVMECKRVLTTANEPETWLFLRESKSQDTAIAMALGVAATESETDGLPIVVWEHLSVEPMGPDVEFAAPLRDKSSGDHQTAKLAALLVASCEGLATTLLDFTERHISGRAITTLPRFIYPVLVTNARLVVGTVDPATIDLTNGHVDHEHFDAVVVPYLKFKTDLPSQVTLVHYRVSVDWTMESERSVFIVNATHLQEFLRKFEQGSTMHPSGRLAILRLAKTTGIRD